MGVHLLPEVEPLGVRAAAAWFEGPLRDAVHALKFNDQPWRGRALGRAGARASSELPAVDVVVPVPLSSERLRERGYNQAYRLALGVGDVLHRPLSPGLLRRVRHGVAQSTLDRPARAEIAGSYEGRRVNGRRVLLVDDVTTTGATLAACAEALLLAGAAEVHAWTLAAAP